MFEQGGGGRDREPPVPEQLSGMVCYITVSGFLNGPGFQKMRAALRRECDEIWVVDCSPEGHQPDVPTRIFEGVQHPVCIVLASRSPGNDPAVPAKVRFRSLAKNRREEKFAELTDLTLAGPGWSDCAVDWRAPFLPEFTGGWGDFAPLDSVIGDSGSGVMPGRTWVIAPDPTSLEDRWRALLGTRDAAQRAMLFHPHEGGDRTVDKATKVFTGVHDALASVEFGVANRDSRDPTAAKAAVSARAFRKPVRYGFRSFDRQWIVPDKRLLNRPNPDLWERAGGQQLYLTAPMDRTPEGGPGLSVTSTLPDLHHYAGRGGRVFALWRDAAAADTNITPEALAALTLRYGAAPDPVDVFAYVAALLASPAYTARFRTDLRARRWFYAKQR